MAVYPALFSLPLLEGEGQRFSPAIAYKTIYYRLVVHNFDFLKAISLQQLMIDMRFRQGKEHFSAFSGQTDFLFLLKKTSSQVGSIEKKSKR